MFGCRSSRTTHSYHSDNYGLVANKYTAYFAAHCYSGDRVLRQHIALKRDRERENDHRNCDTESEYARSYGISWKTITERKRRFWTCVDSLHQQSSLEVYGLGKFGVWSVPHAEVIACGEQTSWMNKSRYIIDEITNISPRHSPTWDTFIRGDRVVDPFVLAAVFFTAQTDSLQMDSAVLASWTCRSKACRHFTISIIEIINELQWGMLIGRTHRWKTRFIFDDHFECIEHPNLFVCWTTDRHDSGLLKVVTINSC